MSPYPANKRCYQQLLPAHHHAQSGKPALQQWRFSPPRAGQKLLEGEAHHLVRLKAKAGKEKNVEEFITSALPLANEEAGTITWYAFRIDSSTFGIFDTFSDEEGREAHLGGKIAKALMENAPELLATAPSIEKLDVLAAK